MSSAYIGLGANLGAAHETLATAVRAIAEQPGLRVSACSGLYRSAPVDAEGPDFLNAVIRIEGSLGPLALLAVLQTLEARAGRERPYPNAPRTLDLDLLLFDDQVLETATLTLPHPRLHQRAFVLMPLAELDAELLIPGRGTVRELLRACAGQVIARADTLPWLPADGPPTVFSKR